MKKELIDKLAFIGLQDKKILGTRNHGKDTWYIPGGKREKGESDEQALTREVEEELKVRLIPATIRYYGTFEAQAHGKPEGTLVRMTCYTADYEGALAPGAEVEELQWCIYAQKEMMSVVDHLIFDDLKKKGLIE